MRVDDQACLEGIDMCIDMHVDMRIDTCIDMHIDTCIETVSVVGAYE